jgi:hypothetical protein
VIKVQATIRSTDWAFTQDVDSLDASFVSPKKTASPKQVSSADCLQKNAQAPTVLGFFIDLILRNAPALLPNLLQGYGPAAVRSRQLTVVLI